MGLAAPSEREPVRRRPALTRIGPKPGEADFAPAFRLARKLGEDRFIGLEYYADFGRIGDFLPLREQSHQLNLEPQHVRHFFAPLHVHYPPKRK